MSAPVLERRTSFEEVSVHPEHARKGLGRQLVACLIEAGCERGCAGLDLTALPHAK
ncbi:MAG: GNAT family N-acetyltransferase [Myxococcota bacterium]